MKTYIPAHTSIPEAGQHMAIGHGLHWLRMPLPMDLNHINLWLMESPTGWTIVDSGFNSPETRGHWEVFFQKTCIEKPVENIFITHFHPDHFGLAGWLAERTGIPIQITPGEFGMIRSLTDPAAHDLLTSQYTAHYHEAGVEKGLLAQLLEKRMLYQKIISPPPEAPHFVTLGETVTLGGRLWRIIGGSGHCPEHACLYQPEEKVFISGDIVLPDISPNISFFPGNAPEHNPLDDYLKTLDAVMEKIPDDVTVLPSHGVPFHGLHRRIKELKAHHQERFEKLQTICADQPQTALEIMEKLFSHRKLKPGDLFFALGETLSHLVYEEKAGRLKKSFQNGHALYRSG